MGYIAIMDLFSAQFHSIVGLLPTVSVKDAAKAHSLGITQPHNTGHLVTKPQA